MLRRGELRKALGGAPLVYQSRTERLAQAKGRTYYYYQQLSCDVEASNAAAGGVPCDPPVLP